MKVVFRWFEAEVYKISPTCLVDKTVKKLFFVLIITAIYCITHHNGTCNDWISLICINSLLYVLITTCFKCFQAFSIRHDWDVWRHILMTRKSPRRLWKSWFLLFRKKIILARFNIPRFQIYWNVQAIRIVIKIL